MQIDKQQKGGRTGAAVLVYHCDAVVDGVARVPDVDFPTVQVNRIGGNGVETLHKAAYTSHKISAGFPTDSKKPKQFAFCFGCLIYAVFTAVFS